MSTRGPSASGLTGAGSGPSARQAVIAVSARLTSMPSARSQNQTSPCCLMRRSGRRGSRRAAGVDGGIAFEGGATVSVLNVVLPLGSSVLSFVFAAMVLDQWWQRRHSFQLVWGIGLLWYGISAGTEFLGGAFGWTEPVYRVWYLIGAFFVAGYLGVGTIYLLSRSRFGYFAGTTVFIGGLLSLLFSHSSRYPGAGTAGTVAFVIALVGAIAIIAATATRRPLAAHIAMGVLVIGSLAATYLVLTAH